MLLALAIFAAVLILAAVVLKRLEESRNVHLRLNRPVRGNARVNWRRV